MTQMHSEFIRAMALEKQSRYLEAIDAYTAALEDDPDEASAHLNSALLYLMHGDWRRGLPEYEYRWNDPTELKGVLFIGDLPQWRGEWLHGKKIMLWNEQGLGDTIMMSRYLPQVIERAGHDPANVHILIPWPIKKLMACCGIPSGSFIGSPLTIDPTQYAYHCPIMSFPYAFSTTPETIPRPVGFDLPDVFRTPQADSIKKLFNSPRIGVAWRGSHKHSHDKQRSMCVRDFSRITKGLQISALSLQHELVAADKQDFSVSWIQWFGFEDLLDVAYIVERCDLIISVDTAVAHLAASMGKPTWILIQHDPDWRWGLVREDSAWYPGNVRLFRQSKPDVWDDVIERVRGELEQFVVHSENERW